MGTADSLAAGHKTNRGVGTPWHQTTIIPGLTSLSLDISLHTEVIIPFVVAAPN